MIRVYYNDGKLHIRYTMIKIVIKIIHKLLIQERICWYLMVFHYRIC